jgi:hypothetical protein
MAVATALVTLAGDRIGRRQALAGLCRLERSAGTWRSPHVDRFHLLVVLAFVGMERDGTRPRRRRDDRPGGAVPEVTTPERRTWTFAWYNVELDAGQTVGAAAGASSGGSGDEHGEFPDSSGQNAWTFAGCAVALALSAVGYSGSRRGSRSPGVAVETLGRIIDHRTRRIAARLVVLFGLDSLGSGFLNSAVDRLLVLRAVRPVGDPRGGLVRSRTPAECRVPPSSLRGSRGASAW